VTVRVQVVFEKETMADVIASVREWLEGSPGGPPPPRETVAARREREVCAVLAAIKGADSRRFVGELAVAAQRGDAVRFDGALKDRYHKTSGTAFAGIVGGPNKLMRRIAKRDLIVRDPTSGGYRLDPLDAAIVRSEWPVEPVRRFGERDFG
jgi:hypothetical protein